MAIAYRAGSGAQADSTGTGTLTLPGGITAADTVLIITAAFAVLSLASTGTAPVQVSTVGGSFSSVYQLWAFTASGADAGAVITPSGFGSNPWTMAAAAWSGAALPLDVIATGHSTSGAATFPAPSATTVAGGDWGVFFAAQIANEFLSITAPPGSTSRVSAGLYPAAIADGNASAGPGGTVIGGASWTTGGNAFWGGFTAGLAPPGAAASPPGLLMAGIA